MNTLDELEPAARAAAGAAGAAGALELTFDLPMPGVSYLHLVPHEPGVK
jgi:hypothetical protein